MLSSVSLTTAQRRLSLIDAFYADALRSALVEHNPFASLPPLQASSLPPRPLILSSSNSLTTSAAVIPSMAWLLAGFEAKRSG